MSISSKDKRLNILKPNPTNRVDQKHHLMDRVDEKTALEFSLIMQRRADSDKGLQSDINSTASEKASRLKERSQRTSSDVPSAFIKTGRSHHEIQPGEQLQGNSIERFDSAHGVERSSTIRVEAGNSVSTKSVVETIHKSWLNDPAQPKSQSWSVQLISAGNISTSLLIECNEHDEWTVQGKANRDQEMPGSDNDTHNMNDTIVGWDISQFCIELESRLRISQPHIRFSALVR